jgi:hypothetical protein
VSLQGIKQGWCYPTSKDRVISEGRLLFANAAVTSRDAAVVDDDDNDGGRTTTPRSESQALHPKIQLHSKHLHPKLSPSHLPCLLPTVGIRFRDRIAPSVGRCGSLTLALHDVQHWSFPQHHTRGIVHRRWSR